MDNLCHTLAGAAFAEAGLKQTTRFGTACLLIAANVPDVDALAFLADVPAVALRRGWSHGVLAQALLPCALTAVFMVLDWWRPPRTPGSLRVRPAAMLLLAFVGVLSHVGLDWLNTYGIRLLMPLSDRWFYGDAVFIIDPWLWIAFGAGVFLSVRRRHVWPSRIALFVATAYIGIMIVSATAARQRVLEAWVRATGQPPAALMVGPAPVNPLAKRVIVDAGDYYHRGTFDWLTRRARFEPHRLPRLETHPAARAAADHPDFRAIRVWSRFPRYEIEPAPAGTRVTLSDMRFGSRIGSVSTVVPAND